MSFKCGIIGLPNVGKSTLFNALTKSNSAEVANFPFCTIKPNVGIVSVPDVRIDRISKIVSPQKVSNAFIEFVDIAGLVKGASKGEGLGNQFLENIKNTDAIVHVVRCFKNDNISHIYNFPQPKRDIDIVNSELILSDFDICAKLVFNLEKKIKFDKNVEKILIILKKCLYHLKNFLPLRTLNLDKNEQKNINCFRFLTLKPTMYIANIDEKKESYDFLTEVKHIAQKDGSLMIPIYSNLESELMRMNTEEQKSFMEEFNIQEFGLNHIIRSGYNLLNLITFFTVGVKEIRAWSIPRGATSIYAANKIHSDFRKGFIRAQVIKYIDFIKYKSEIKLKALGKYRNEGKLYKVQDGDIINFLFNI